MIAVALFAVKIIDLPSFCASALFAWSSQSTVAFAASKIALIGTNVVPFSTTGCASKTIGVPSKFTVMFVAACADNVAIPIAIVRVITAKNFFILKTPLSKICKYVNRK